MEEKQIYLLNYCLACEFTYEEMRKEFKEEGVQEIFDMTEAKYNKYLGVSNL